MASATIENPTLGEWNALCGIEQMELFANLKISDRDSIRATIAVKPGAVVLAQWGYPHGSEIITDASGTAQKRIESMQRTHALYGPQQEISAPRSARVLGWLRGAYGGIIPVVEIDATDFNAYLDSLDKALSSDTPDHGEAFRCRSCGATGVSGQYPFSTNPSSGLCDDCGA